MNGIAGAIGMQPSWQEAKAPDGRIYFFKPGTQETSWQKPLEMMSPNERSLAGTPWKEYKNSDGRQYWHNPQTSETTWVMPEAVMANLKALQDEQARQTPVHPSAPWAAGPISVQPTYNQRGHDRDEYQSDRRDRDRDRDRDREAGYLNSDRLAANFGSSTEILFTNPQDAEDAFKKVLKKLNVQSDWSWADTIRAGIKDPHWRAIPDPKDRENCFKSYCEELRAQDKAKENDRQLKLRSDFLNMLRSHPDIKHYTRWKTALPIIENETIFRSAKDDAERRSLFYEYISSLKRAHTENQAEERKSALDSLITLLHGLNLDPFTRWHAAEGMITNNDEFTSEKYTVLSKLDVLNTFEQHVRDLQRELNDKVQIERRAKGRIERQTRDAYVGLLHELRSAGKLRPSTKWKDIHALIHDDPRYVAILGQPGSSPLDLFFDVLSEEELRFRALGHTAINIGRAQSFEVTANTPFEDFCRHMRSDPEIANLDEQSMRTLFSHVLAKTRKRDEEDRRDSEHHEKRVSSDFRAMLKYLDPPVLPTSTWEEIRPRVEKTDEYRAIKSESDRQSAFDVYVKRLEQKKRERAHDREPRRERDQERERDRDRERTRRDPRDRERDRDRDRRERDREYRNGHSDRRHRTRTRTRSPENDPYAAERRRAQEDREARAKLNEHTGLSPPRRSNRDDRHDMSRRGSGDHYRRERLQRDAEREYSRADPREIVSELDYGDSAGRPIPSRRRRESDGSASRREAKRPRYSPNADSQSKTPAIEPATEAAKAEDAALRSGSEEGEIEED